jgi:hypothetical protein
MEGNPSVCFFNWPKLKSLHCRYVYDQSLKKITPYGPVHVCLSVSSSS